MEEIVTDIIDLVQEFWTSTWTSSNGAVGTSFFARRSSCLLKILQKCFESFDCLDVVVCQCFFATAVDLADNNLQTSTKPYNSWRYLFDEYRMMIDESFSKSKDLGDMLRFLPGVVAQKGLSMQGMADLYKIKPEFLEHLIKSIEPLRQSPIAVTYMPTTC